jgi:fructose-bisphosphate aldolase class I
MSNLTDVVHALMKQGKGILAADESNTTANKRFNALGIPETEDNRRRWRELLFTTPGVEEYISGVILFDETLRQVASTGRMFSELLAEKDILVGIKVDQGLEDVEGGQVTKGLDTLATRLDEYALMHAAFTKWRAVAKVGDGYGDQVIKENAKRMAEYAKIAQSKGFVPIVEPEVLMEGTHSAEDAEGALIETVAIAFDALKNASAEIPHLILKTSMAVSGKEAPDRAAPDEVGERTVRALKTSVPENVGGVVFLSGGQSPQESCANLNAIARIEPLPWPITFSFSRALQSEAMSEWKGLEENLDEAQALFLKRITCAVAADAGAYSPGMESSAL